MSSTIHFLRNYEFLDLTKSVTESKMALYKEPNKTWGDIGNKFCTISYYNALSIGSVGADLATYLALSSLRSIGLFRPLPPEPPIFPVPFDNVQFLEGAIKRALWDWDASSRKEIEEGIESSYSENWNIFQVVGEWALAYSLENMERSSYFKPTFLTISEPLENGTSFRSVSSSFAWLWQSEKKAILHALYHQTEPPSLGSRAQQVYQDLRGLASKLHQGNQNYLLAFSEYSGKKTPSPPPLEQPVHVPPIPSAPPLSQVNPEMAMALDIAYLRSALSTLPSNKQPWVKEEILSHNRGSNRSDVQYLLARLTLLQALEPKNKKPSFLPWNNHLESGKTLQQVLQDFSHLKKADIAKLREAVIESWRESLLSPSLKKRMADLNEFGRIFAKHKNFLKLYEALRIDLLAA